MLACPVLMEFKRMLGHRSTSVFALTGGSESSSGCQNVSIGVTVPTGIK